MDSSECWGVRQVPRAVGTSNVFAPYPWKSAESKILVKYLKNVCSQPGTSERTQTTTMCWGLTQAHQVMFSAVQYPWVRRRSLDKATHSAATLTIGTVWLLWIPVTDAATEAETQHVPVWVAPVQKQKQCTQKSYCKKALAKAVKEDKKVREGKEDEEAGPSKGPFSLPLPRPLQGPS